MFNWICPQCGSEVLSSYSECPQCAKGGTQPGQPVTQPLAAQPVVAQPVVAQPVAAQPVPQQVATPPPTQPAVSGRSILFGSAPPRYGDPIPQAQAPQPQQPYYPPQQPQYPPYYAPQPQPRSGMPTWLMSILFAVGFVVLGAGVYWLLNHNKDATPSTASAAGSGATGAAGKSNPMQKFIEVTGVRLFQNTKKQVEAKFLIVNHSEGEITDLGGTVEIRGRTAKEGELPVGTFSFKGISIGPNDAKEATAPVDTKLKVYELPDWQLVDARVQITSPQ